MLRVFGIGCRGPYAVSRSKYAHTATPYATLIPYKTNILNNKAWACNSEDTECRFPTPNVEGSSPSLLVHFFPGVEMNRVRVVLGSAHTYYSFIELN